MNELHARFIFFLFPCNVFKFIWLIMGSERKTVIVDVIRVIQDTPFHDEDDQFEVSFIRSNDGSEHQLVVECLEKKSSALRAEISISDYIFKQESSVNRNKFVRLGENSPFKDRATVQFILKPKLAPRQLFTPAGLFFLYITLKHEFS